MVQALFLFGTPILLLFVGLQLSRRKREPPLLQRLTIVGVSLLPVAVLALLLPADGSSFSRLGMFLWLALPVGAVVYFSQSSLARERQWLVVVIVPLLWAVGLFTGCVLAVNLGLAHP